jgi:CheY-like chemotaxis protein
MVAQPPTRPSPVLVVEDEELLRLYAADLLEERGFEVMDAADAMKWTLILGPGVKLENGRSV